MEKKKIIYSCESPAQTRKIGNLLAREVLKKGAGIHALVLRLYGELGAGKTQFVQGFAQGLGIKETVNSPTFSIMKKYPFERRGDFNFFYHIDCYRLDSGRDLVGLGIENILSDPAAIVAVEWPAVAQNVIDFGDVLDISIEAVGKNKRKIIFCY